MPAAAISDVDGRAWERNPHVAAATALHSRLERGAYHRLLKLPITPDRQVCLERHQLYARHKYDAQLAAAPFLDWLERAADDEVLGGGVFFPGSAIHWHFLIDGLGVLRPPPDGVARALYLDHELTDQQVEMVVHFARAAGFPAFTRLARVDATAHRFEDGVFFCRQRFSAKVAWARTTLGIAASAPTPGTRRIFALRNAPSRRLLNQDRIAALARDRFGFEVVDPSALSLWDQARLFRDAGIVMGAHGSALANTLFAERPAMLVELYHSEAQLFYHSLCYALDVYHLPIRGEPVGEHAGRPDDADYRVDEEAVLRALEAHLDTSRGFGFPPHG